MTAHNPYNQTLLLILTCLNVCVLNGARADAPVQTSLQQAANVTTTAYVQSGRAQKDKEKLDELLAAMMLAGMLPDAPAGESDLGDPDAEDNDQNANRRNQRDRRRRNDQRRRNNRNVIVNSSYKPITQRSTDYEYISCFAIATCCIPCFFCPNITD